MYLLYVCVYGDTHAHSIDIGNHLGLHIGLRTLVQREDRIAVAPVPLAGTRIFCEPLLHPPPTGIAECDVNGARPAIASGCAARCIYLSLRRTSATLNGTTVLRNTVRAFELVV